MRLNDLSVSLLLDPDDGGRDRFQAFDICGTRSHLHGAVPCAEVRQRIPSGLPMRQCHGHAVAETGCS